MLLLLLPLMMMMMMMWFTSKTGENVGARNVSQAGRGRGFKYSKTSGHVPGEARSFEGGMFLAAHVPSEGGSFEMASVPQFPLLS